MYTGSLILGMGMELGSGSNGSSTPPTNSFILQEDGTSFLILEDGSGDLLLES